MPILQSNRSQDPFIQAIIKPDLKVREASPTPNLYSNKSLGHNIINCTSHVKTIKVSMQCKFERTTPKSANFPRPIYNTIPVKVSRTNIWSLITNMSQTFIIGYVTDKRRLSALVMIYDWIILHPLKLPHPKTSNKFHKRSYPALDRTILMQSNLIQNQKKTTKFPLHY